MFETKEDVLDTYDILTRNMENGVLSNTRKMTICYKIDVDNGIYRSVALYKGKISKLFCIEDKRIVKQPVARYGKLELKTFAKFLNLPKKKIKKYILKQF